MSDILYEIYLEIMYGFGAGYIVLLVVALLIVLLLIRNKKRNIKNKTTKNPKNTTSKNKTTKDSNNIPAKTIELPRLTEIGDSKLDRFFVECVLSGCNDFTLEKNVAKAELFAKKYLVAYPNGIEETFNLAFSAHIELNEQIKLNKLSEKKKEEQALCFKLNKYSDLHGKEKKNKMLTDKMHELLEKAKLLDEGARMLMKSTQQREKDWALWGGVADGIAGVGAGVMTALEIQTQNAQIRAENEARRAAALPAYYNITNNASQNRSNASKIQKELLLLREKLVSDMPAEDVFHKLRFENTSIEISETGAFTVSATVSPKEKLFIYGDVPAVADGTIIAHVFENGKEIGKAYMVLPVDGVSKQTGIIGMSLSEANIGQKHTIEFSADNLWLMEA